MSGIGKARGHSKISRSRETKGDADAALFPIVIAPFRGAATGSVPNHRLKLTGAAILVFRASMFLKAAPAA